LKTHEGLRRTGTAERGGHVAVMHFVWLRLGGLRLRPGVVLYTKMMTESSYYVDSKV
jgi:hypothetical protein